MGSLRWLTICACFLAVTACGGDPVSVTTTDSEVTTTSNPTGTQVTEPGSLPTEAPTEAPTTAPLPTAPVTVPATDPSVTPVAAPLDSNTTPGNDSDDTTETQIDDPSVSLNPAISISSSIPEQLTSPASSVLGEIQAFAIINNTERFELDCCDEINAATGLVPVSSGGRFTITVEWQERYLGQILPLVSTSRVVQVTRGATPVVLLDSSFTLSGDLDGDGVLNLTERIEGSNPFDSNDSLLVNLPANVDVAINRFPEGIAPVIDGVLDQTGDAAGLQSQSIGEEWQHATTMDRSGQTLTISTVLAESDDGATSTEPSHRWAAGHDGEYLYLLVISDDAGLHRFDSDDRGKRWKDDDLEIYLDGDNSRLSMYDGVNDANYHINLIGDSELLANPVANSSADSGNRTGVGPNSVSLPEDSEALIFEVGLLAGPVSTQPERGATDIYEIRISLDALGIQTGSSFGFDLHINDDDDGDDRDNKWAWAHPIGNGIELDTTWINPSLMGTAYLQP